MNSSLKRLVFWLLLISLSIGLAYFGSTVLIPFVFSMFIAVALLPVCKWFEKKGVGRTWAVVWTGVGTFIFMLLIALVLTVQLWQFSKEYPVLQDKAVEAFISTAGWVTEHFPEAEGSIEQVVEKNMNSIFSAGGEAFQQIIKTTSSFITVATLIPVYMLFILLYRSNFRRFFIHLAKNNEEDEGEKIVEAIKNVVQKYLGGLMLVILIVAALNSIGMLIIGVKYAIFFGCLAAALTVIPYIGIALGAALPLLFTIIMDGSMWKTIAVLTLFVVVQFLEGNFITPRVIGSKVNINPVAAIFALILGGTVWGIAGMILAIPCVAVLKLIMEHHSSLKPYAVLLQEKQELD